MNTSIATANSVNDLGKTTTYTSSLFCLDNELVDMLVPAGWYSPSEAFWRFFTYAPFVMVSPLFDPSVSFRILSWAIASSCTLYAILILWRVVTHMREPYWIKIMPYYNKGGILAHFIGGFMAEVLSGHVARKFTSRKYPSLIKFHSGILNGWIRDMVLVKDPIVCKQVLEEKTTKKPSKAYRFARRLDGYWAPDDFLTSRSHQDPIYKRTRSLAYKVLMKRSVLRYNDLYLDIVNNFVNSLSSSDTGTERDTAREMHLIATRVLTEMAFDLKDEVLDQEFFECTIWIVNDLVRRPANNALPILDKLPTPRNRKLWAYQKRIQEALSYIVRKKTDALISRGPDEPIADDVVTACIQELSTDMSPLEVERSVCGLVRILFFAGFDTTANTMTIILYHLATIPEIQAKAREEVLSVIGGPEEPITLDKLFQCQFLLAIIKESLRMFPVVPMIAREVQETHKNTGVCPRFNSSSSFGVLINIFALHYNEKGWNRPTEFLPERWLDPSIDVSHADPRERVYCPFALGKRSCFGRQFAYIEMLTVMSSILRMYHIREARNSKIDVYEGGTLLIRNFRTNFTPLEEFTIPKTPANEDLRLIRMSEVIKHHSKNDLWLIIENKVYDLTEFVAGDLGGHPGGAEVLLAWGGCDATAEFMFVAHSPVARRLLKKFLIGALDVHRTENDKPEDDADVDSPQSRSSQISTLAKRGAKYFGLELTMRLGGISQLLNQNERRMMGPGHEIVDPNHLPDFPSKVIMLPEDVESTRGVSSRRQSLTYSCDDWDIAMREYTRIRFAKLLF